MLLQQDLRTPAPAKGQELKSAKKEKRSCEGAPKSGPSSSKRQKAFSIAATPPKGKQNPVQARSSVLAPDACIAHFELPLVRA